MSTDQKPTGAPPARPAPNKGGGTGGDKAAGKPGGRREEVDLFIDEVTEELQKERAYHLFRRYGPFVGAAVVLIVIAASVNEYLRASAVVAAREAGAVLFAAGETTDPLQAASAYGAASEQLEGGAAMVARLHAAGLRDEAEQNAEAADAFAAIAAGAEGQVYADLGKLRESLAAFDIREPDALIAELEPLSGPDRPFRPLALELIGAAHLRAGNVAAAHIALREAFEDPGAPRSLRDRAARLIVGSGGRDPSAPPETPEEVAPANDTPGTGAGDPAADG